MQNQWYIARDGKQYGPVSDADLAQLVKDRELLDGDYLWRNGFENWLPAAQVSEIRDLASNVAGAPATPGAQKAIVGANHDAISHDKGKPLTGASVDQSNAIDQGDQTGFQANAKAAGGAAERPIDPADRRSSSDIGGAYQPSQQRERQADAYAHEGNDTNSGDLMAANSIARGVDVQDLVEDDELDPAMAYGQQQQKGVGQAQGTSSLGGVYNSTHNMSAHNNGVGVDLGSVKSAEHTNAMNAHTAAAKGGGDAKKGISWPLMLGAGVGVVFLLLIAATFALPFIIPPDTIKRQISSALKEKTGRDISIRGKLSYRFFPSLGADLNNIVIHNPPEIKGPEFVSIGRLQANLKLIPLFSKRIEVDRIILHRPEIALIDTGKGQTNYEIKSAALFNQNLLARALSAAQDKSRSFKVAQEGAIDTSDLIARHLERLEKEAAAKAETEAKTKPQGQAVKTQAKIDPNGPEIEILEQSSGGDGIQVGEIEIINGGLKLINQKENTVTEVSAINLRLQAPAAEKDITAEGSVRFRQDRINLKGSVSTLGQLLKEEPVTAKFDVKSDRFEGKFDGEVRTKNGLEYQGETDIQTFSLQKLLNWFDVDVPKQGYGGAYVRGTLTGTPEAVILKKATIKVDKATLIGDLRFKSTGKRPTIEAVLKTDRLDLDPYMAQKQNIKRGDIDGILGTRKTAIAAWNSNKIDLSFLNAFDGASQLDPGQLIAAGHSIDKVRLNAKLVAGLMTAVLPQFQIYGGSGQMNLALNGAKSRPTLKSKLNLKKIQIQPFLQKSADLDFLSGAADVVLDVVSSGTSQSEFISGLNGTGKFSVTDGALKGVNIPGLLRNIQSGRLDKLVSKPSETTDFSELTASFSIDRGVVSNKDLLMKGPLLRMSGKGLINLPTERIDYGVTPKLVGSLAGQGGTDATGISVPLLIKGPLASPSIQPDLQGLLTSGQGIDATVKNVEKLVKGIKKKKISSEEMKGLLNGMIKGDGDVGNLLEGVLQ